ncbi:MAG: hypothetical protein MJ201_02090 [Mycoplasmoidaceae bacterium]|nr:hypothetical protein [Mycoplasmoidaceae bacterium]
MTFNFLFHSEESPLGQDINGTCYQGFDKTIFTVGTTFDNITKPIVAPDRLDLDDFYKDC